MIGNVMQWLRRFRHSESGSAMVETALTFPFFVALLLGAVEMGDLAYKSVEITNAARSAAQYAASTGGAYTDCNGKVPTTLQTCTSTSGSPSGIYATAQADATLVNKSCTSFTVKALTTCTCSDGTSCTCAGGTCSTSSTGGYACSSGRPVIMVKVYTSASCSPAASVPNLFPSGTAFTLDGFSQQEVTQ